MALSGAKERVGASSQEGGGQFGWGDAIGSGGFDCEVGPSLGEREEACKGEKVRRSQKKKKREQSPSTYKVWKGIPKKRACIPFGGTCKYGSSLEEKKMRHRRSAFHGQVVRRNAGFRIERGFAEKSRLKVLPDYSPLQREDFCRGKSLPLGKERGELWREDSSRLEGSCEKKPSSPGNIRLGAHDKRTHSNVREGGKDRSVM